MKKTHFLPLLFLLSALLGACAGPSPAPGTEPPATEPPAPREVRIHSISELNTKSARDSHAGETSFATMEADWRAYFELEAADLGGIRSLYYPRLKLLPNGKYILFFQNGRAGPDIYYALSEDGRTFREPKLFFRSTNDTAYATCDALVLSNGDLLAVASFRTPKDYLRHPQTAGLVLRVSHDSGETWTPSRRVFVGCNWEPYLLQLSSGEVQLYFTNTYGRETPEGVLSSTGVAMLRSFDNGETWNGSLARPYSAQIVSQSKTENVGGVQLFSEQMPSAVELHNGGIAMAMEVRLDRTGKCVLTMAYSPDNWAKSLKEFEEEGPADKIDRFTAGIGPYLRQLESGETLLVYGRSEKLAFRMGDENGKSLGPEIFPYSMLSSNRWSAMEVLSSHAVLTVNQTYTKEDFDTTKLVFGTLRLDHRVTADRFSVTADGDNTEWEGHDEALFVGSASQAQESLRFGHEDGYLSVLCERLDRFPSEEDVTALYLSPKADKDSYLLLRFGADGIVSAVSREGNGTTQVDPDRILFGSFVRSPAGEADDGAGYLAELKIPLDLLPGLGEDLSVGIIMDNRDGEKATRDVPDGFSIGDVSTWFKVVLG